MDRAIATEQIVGQRLGPRHVDEHVGTGLEGTASLASALGVYADRQPMTMCGVGLPPASVASSSSRATAVQYHLDQVMTMRGGLVDRAYAVRGSCQFAHRSRRSPGSIRAGIRQPRSGMVQRS